jgi:hypothetical protein
MSTLDVVAYAGEEFTARDGSHPRPANFLDIGGGADAKVMANGLDIIFEDHQVKAVFVNVFGGITACDAGRQRHRQGLRDPRQTASRPSRSSCGWTATTPRRAGDPRRVPGCLCSNASTPWTVRLAASPNSRLQP